jgi:UDP-glucuronate 4-epimerase
MAYMIFTRKILAGETIDVFGEGNMGRDFTYVEDCADGIVRALDHPPAKGPDDVPHEVFNLGNDTPERLGDLIGHIEQLLGQEAEKRYLPMQPGDVRETWANIEKARTKLGYNPATDLKTGLAHFVAWYRDYYR